MYEVSPLFILKVLAGGPNFTKGVDVLADVLLAQARDYFLPRRGATRQRGC
jgi:hypothetical protein